MAKPTGHGGRDSPDYGTGSVTRGMGCDIDAAELAARLWSPQWFDRQGTTLFMEDFSHGIGSWATGKTPATTTITTSTYNTYLGPYSLRFATTIGVGNEAHIERGLPFPYYAPVGFQFCFYNTGLCTYIEQEMELLTRVSTLFPAIRIDADSNELYYKDNVGSWVKFADVGLGPYNGGQYHVAKLVVDLELSRYERFILDTVEYDLSSYSIQAGAADSKDVLVIKIRLDSNDAQAEELFIDNVVLTINEPS